MKAPGVAQIYLSGSRYPGPGYLAGTVVDGSSNPIPYRRIAVLDRQTKTQVALVIGDASSAWRVEDLAIRPYTIVVSDPTDTFNAGRHDNVIPVI